MSKNNLTNAERQRRHRAKVQADRNARNALAEIEAGEIEAGEIEAARARDEAHTRQLIADFVVAHMPQAFPCNFPRK